MTEHRERGPRGPMDDVLRRMRGLAAGKANDAVKLAFLDGDRVEEIGGLDLTALAEFKRSANGAVEIKLVDRLAVLGKLAALLGEGREDAAGAFLRALEGPEGGDGAG